MDLTLLSEICSNYWEKYPDSKTVLLDGILALGMDQPIDIPTMRALTYAIMIYSFKEGPDSFNRCLTLVNCLGAVSIFEEHLRNWVKKRTTIITEINDN